MSASSTAVPKITSSPQPQRRFPWGLVLIAAAVLFVVTWLATHNGNATLATLLPPRLETPEIMGAKGILTLQLAETTKCVGSIHIENREGQGWSFPAQGFQREINFPGGPCEPNEIANFLEQLKEDLTDLGSDRLFRILENLISQLESLTP